MVFEYTLKVESSQSHTKPEHLKGGSLIFVFLLAGGTQVLSELEQVWDFGKDATGEMVHCVPLLCF